MSLCKCEPILKWMRNCDHILYQALVEILIPDVLRPVPSKWLAGCCAPRRPCAFLAPHPRTRPRGRPAHGSGEACHLWVAAHPGRLGLQHALCCRAPGDTPASQVPLGPGISIPLHPACPQRAGPGSQDSPTPSAGLLKAPGRVSTHCAPLPPGPPAGPPEVMTGSSHPPGR